MPPIVMEGILTDINSFLQPLRENYGITNIYIKYTRYSTLAYTFSSKDYQNLLKHVKHEQEAGEHRVNFHTYIHQQRRLMPSSSGVWRINLPPDEVKEALMLEYDLEVQNVYALQTRGPST